MIKRNFEYQIELMSLNSSQLMNNNNNNTYTLTNPKSLNYWLVGNNTISGTQPTTEQDMGMNMESLSIDNEAFLESQYLNDHLNMDHFGSDVSSSTLAESTNDSHSSKTTPEFSELTTMKYEESALQDIGYLLNQPQIPHSQDLYYPNDVTGSLGMALPIDQLNLLSLTPMASTQVSKSPSPEIYNNIYKDDKMDERTVNPRELFTTKIPVSVSSPSLTTLFMTKNNTNYNNYTTNKVSKNSSQSESKPSVDQQIATPNFDFKMNNECVNAISYWLNNTLETVDSDENIDASAAEIMTNPTGIIKSNFYYRRRNSIQLSNPSSYIRSNEEKVNSGNIYNQKRKRRKSYNYDSTINSVELTSSIKPAGSRNAVPKVKLEPSIELLPSSQQHVRQRQQSPIRSVKASPMTTPRQAQKEKTEDNHLEEEETPTYPCPNCDKQFKRSEHLKRHHRSVHSNIRPFHCKYCEKKFSRSDNLAQHLKTHFKVNSNGTTSLIYGNPNVNRKRKE